MRHSIGYVNLALFNPPVGLARYGRKVLNIISKEADITAYCFDGEARDEVDAKNVEIVSVFNAKKYKFIVLKYIMYAYAILKLTFKIKKEHDVVISFGAPETYMIFFNKVFLRRKAKTILEMHHVTGGLTLKEQLQHSSLAFSIMNAYSTFILVKKFDGIITVSDFWKRRIHNFYDFPLKNIYVATVGVEDVEERKSGNILLDLPHPIIYAGITTKEHNIELIINSLPIIKERFGSVSLVLTGRKNKKYFHKLFKLAQSLGVDDSIHYLGVLPEKFLPDIYKESDLVVYTPTEEIGWSAVLLKGILYKKPGIAINRGALKEFIKRYDGIIITNNTKSFSDAVIRLMENKELRENIVSNAYERAMKDTWDNTAKTHLECIREVMK